MLMSLGVLSGFDLISESCPGGYSDANDIFHFIDEQVYIGLFSSVINFLRKEEIISRVFNH
jgi:hypothetical protein